MAPILRQTKGMARGWESKSVESQQDAEPAADQRRHLTPEQRKLFERRHGLELSRTRVVEELAATTAPVRRAALEGALAALDAEIAVLRRAGG